MADTTLPLLTSGAAVATNDLFISRQGADTVDKKVTAAQIATYVASTIPSGSGDVSGPASSTDNAIARYDGTTGKIIQNSSATISDAGAITATNLSGTNTGDQTSIVGITGTKAQFDTACSDGNFLYTGDAPTSGFTTIAVSGQSNVVADSITDTLTLVAGTNITITTDAATDAITINSSGGGGGGISALTGDVTASGTGSVVATIANAAVTQAKTANYTANTFWGNPTGSAATAIDVPLNYIAETTYTGTITWTGTTAPSGATNQTYRWHQIGKMCFLRINLTYGTGGAALTQVVVSLPAGAPVPETISGYASGDVVLFGSGNLSASASTTVATRAAMRHTTNDLVLVAASGAYRFAVIDITYMTA